MEKTYKFDIMLVRTSHGKVMKSQGKVMEKSWYFMLWNEWPPCLRLSINRKLAGSWSGTLDPVQASYHICHHFKDIHCRNVHDLDV